MSTTNTPLAAQAADIGLAPAIASKSPDPLTRRGRRARPISLFPRSDVAAASELAHRWIGALSRRIDASFGAKIIALCALVTTIGLLLAFTAFQWQDWNADRADLVADQDSLTAMLAPTVSQAAGNPAKLEVAIGMAQGNEHTTAAVWFPTQGAPVQLMAPSDGLGALRADHAAARTVTYLPHGVVVATPYIVNGERLGELVLRTDAGDIAGKLVRNSIVAGFLIFGATLISALLAIVLGRRALKPLHALDGGIERVRRSGDLTARAAVVSHDEFGRLSQNFNGLLSDLQGYDERLQRNVQELREAKEAAEEASVLKSQFLANMSHEIRTPLNGVLGMAQVMALGELSSVQRERLDVIKDSGGALLTVLNDILDLSKIEAGRMELETGDFDAAETVGAACAAFTAAAAAKALAFTIEVAPDASGLWRGDGMRVRQVVSNLVSNAIKFTSSGEVRVRVDAEPAGDDRVLTIRVTDTGIGIGKDVLPKLFEKFVQADSTTTRKYGGAGLGLAISRMLVELMGGSIGVHSAPGVGTSFEVRLPLAWSPAQAPAEVAADDEEGPDLSALHVLSAEDNPTNRQVLGAVMDALGVDTTFVENGRLAVDAWKGGGFDLILMDIQMPVLDGVSAAREIRALEAARGPAHTPIFALTANAMQHQVSEYEKAGMDGHLAKPIAIEALYGVLANVAAGPAAEVRAA